MVADTNFDLGRGQDRRPRSHDFDLSPKSGLSGLADGQCAVSHVTHAQEKSYVDPEENSRAEVNPFWTKSVHFHSQPRGQRTAARHATTPGQHAGTHRRAREHAQARARAEGKQ